VTTLSNTFARITFVAPDGNGETVDYFRVKILQSDGLTYSE